MGVPCRKVDLDDIRDFIEDENPKRINFANYHVHALRRVTGKDGLVARTRTFFW